MHRNVLICILLCASVLAVSDSEWFSGSSEDTESDFDNVSDDQSAARMVCNWIAKTQYDAPDHSIDGGITMHVDSNLEFSGYRWWQIYPYHSNLALWGYLSAGCSDSLKRTEKYIKWYFRHLCRNWKFEDGKKPKKDCPFDGVIIDYWVNVHPGTSRIPSHMKDSSCPKGIKTHEADNHKGHHCNFADSEDAYAGTFIGLIEAYLNEGGDIEFVRAERENIEAIAKTMLKLTRSNGLSIAKKSYPVFYTMDNAETAWGLRAMSHLLRYVWNDEKQVEKYDQKYQKMRKALNTKLWCKRKGMYYGALDEDVSPTEWYGEGGVTMSVWPGMFDVSSESHPERAKNMVELLNKNFPRWKSESQDGGFPWASVGFAAAKVGYKDWTRQELDWIYREKISRNFVYPWSPSDAGWVLKSYVEINGGKHIAAETLPPRAQPFWL